MLVLWFNTILRAYLLLYDREKYEKLLSDLEKFYYELSGERIWITFFWELRNDSLEIVECSNT